MSPLIKVTGAHLSSSGPVIGIPTSPVLETTNV
jgi:hypothetical protein